ncbi:MAG: YncE family protein [Thermoguttaceae bacterium]
MKKYVAILLTLTFCTALFGDEPYSRDRVYTANQVSNTVSVIDPQTRAFLGEIVLGKPNPNTLTALYKGVSLVHGLRYDPHRQRLAVVSVGSNSVTFLSTTDNSVVKTVYVGRAPHEPTYTPDGREVWVTVRGESHLSVIDAETMEETRKIAVADGPGMIAFTPDSKFAYVCSSFTPQVDVVDATSYRVVRTIPVISPFSPNIFTSPDGTLVALSHKDIGKISVIDTATNTVVKILETGRLTNHVSFLELDGKLLMAVTVGGENVVKFFDVANDYALLKTVAVGVLPHGLWSSPDGRCVYVGLEYADAVQPIDVTTLTALAPITIGQSPQALVYAAGAVNEAGSKTNLTPLRDKEATRVIVLAPVNENGKEKGQLSVRTVGQTQLIEQQFANLKPDAVYTLALSRSRTEPKSDSPLNVFAAETSGKYAASTTGIFSADFACVVLIENATQNVVLISPELKEKP